MGKKLIMVVSLLLWVAAAAHGERIQVGAEGSDIDVIVEESSDSRTIMRVDINAFDRTAVEIDGVDHFLLNCADEHTLLNAGEPALPQVCRSIIIPDDAGLEVRVLAADFVDFPETRVAPSKGSLPRTINPADVPYEFGPVYNTSDWYPGALASLREPYILRDFRGTVVELNAFRYNPAKQALRVYTSVTLEIVSTGPGETNVIRRDKGEIGLVPDFELIYKRRFLNYEAAKARYTPVEETGQMLIITYDDFHDEMLPLVEWKRQKGIKTTIVDVSGIGNNSTAIDSYIQAFYDVDSTLAWVLLVGDAAQVSPGGASSESDPSYSKVKGTDHYPDIFVGRFSAQSPGDVLTQVERTINYEKTPSGIDWFHKATGIASTGGPGHHGEYDYQHADLMRDDLLAYNYTEVDQIYDPSGSAADVTAALNEGRTYVNYTGHGSTTSWGTTNFSNSHVNALTNDYMLPFIFSVACLNGDFISYTCFAEAWLRATNGDAPTGAIATYMSVISQDWDPPMDAQDEAVDLLVAEEKLTVGGLCFNGSCLMMDLNGSDGVNEFNAWTIFGDPSIKLRTTDPAEMTVSHESAIIFTTADMEVQVMGIEGALCAIYHDGVLYGSAYTGSDGIALIEFEEELPIGQGVTLTVTSYNMLPYIATVQVISPEGPFVLYDEHIIDDLSGNNDGLANCGETVGLDVQLQNVGPDTAYDVTAVLRSSDAYVTITDSTESYGEIPGDFGIVSIPGAFTCDFAGDTPDGHVVQFELAVTGSDVVRGDTTWTSAFTVTVHSPTVTFVTVVVDDASGNNNGNLDPGETAELVVLLVNNGSADALSVSAVLSEDDPLVTISDADGTFGDLVSGGGSGDNSSDVFVVSADESGPLGYEMTFHLTLTGSGGYSSVVDFDFVVGDRVAFFSDNFSFDQGWTGLGGSGEWTIGPAVGGSGSDSYGGPDPSEDHSFGEDNYVMGNDLTAGSGGDYNGSLGSTYWVTSPLFDCSGFAGVELTFWRWLGVESSSYDHVYLQAFNGIGWVTLFENSSTVDESEWTMSYYDLSEIADGNMDFQIRFGIGVTDGSMNYCGWNIDDLELRGYGEIASGSPAIVCQPENLDDSLHLGESAVDTLRVYNTGEVLLRVRFSSADGWLSFDTEQHNIAAGDSLILPVTVSTASLSPGDYNGQLQYSSNDPLHTSGSVAVNLHIYSPDISLPSSFLGETLAGGEQSSVDFVIDNSGPGRLEYDILRLMFNGKETVVAKETSVRMPLGYRPADADKGDGGETEPYFAAVTKDYGGPDLWGYNWVDSDDPEGPHYGWVDISSVGTSVELGDDDSTTALPLGFEFPFYENSYSELYIGSNGIVTFGTGSTQRTNKGIPDTLAPNNLVALWWDDLDPRKGGQILYYADASNERFIVSFEGIPNYYSTTGTGSLTFQAIFQSDGKILLQYGVMNPGDDYDGLTGSSVGIENSAGDDGLEVVYDAEYIHDNLAILFTAASWLSVSPAAGTIEPFESDTVSVGFDATDMVEGDYSGQLTITSNDPDTPLLEVPVTLTVGVTYICGDANGDEAVNLTDVTYIINYLYKEGPVPDPEAAADADGSGTLNLVDATHLINYLYKEGPPPVCQ